MSNVKQLKDASGASFSPKTSIEALTSTGGGGKFLVTSELGVEESTLSVTNVPQISGTTEAGHFAIFDSNGDLQDSSCNEETFIKGVQQNGTTIQPVNGVVNVTVQDGEDGKSAFEIAQQQGYTGTIDEWLASLKANIGEFLFVPTDAAAVTAMATIGQTYPSAIDPQGKNVAPSQNTLSVILLMNAGTTPDKTMMIATQDDGNNGYEFVYAGNLQDAMPSNVLTEDRIVNDFNGGTTNVASAETVKTLNENKIEKQEVEYGFDELTSQAEVVGYISSATGNIIDSTGPLRVETFDVTAGETYYLTGRCSTSGTRACAAFYDENDTMIGDAIIGNDVEDVAARSIVEEPHVAPATATKVKVATSSYTSYPISCKVKTIISAQDNQAILESVGDVSELETTEKDTVVGAVNEVNGKVDDVNEVIDNTVMPHTAYKFSDTPVDGFEAVKIGTQNYSISQALGSYQNKWIAGTSFSAWVQVNPGEAYKLEAKTDNCRYALLKNNDTPVHNQYPNYSDYAPAPISVYNGEFVIITIPSDTHYLWKATRTSSTTATPINLDCYLGEGMEVEGLDERFVELEDRITELIAESGHDILLKDTTKALLTKDLLIRQERDYYFTPDYFKEVADSDNQWYQDINTVDGYTETGYLDSKIASVPIGKHFIFTTDSHIDYFNLYPRQKETPVISYVKDKLDVNNVVFGGDAIGGPMSLTSRYGIKNIILKNRYIAAKILSIYAGDKFQAFGSDFIYCQGNHDANSPDANKAAKACVDYTQLTTNSDYNAENVADSTNPVPWTTPLTAEEAAAYGFSTSPITEISPWQAIMLGYISSTEVCKRTFDVMARYGNIVFDEKLIAKIDAIDFSSVASYHTFSNSFTYTKTDSDPIKITLNIDLLNDLELMNSVTIDNETISLGFVNYTASSLKEEFKNWARMHYYYDNDTQKIRYIVLDTWDYGMCARMLTKGSGGYMLMNLLIDFVIDSLVSIKKDYDVVIVGHEIDSYDSGGFKTFFKILDAYKNKKYLEITISTPNTSLASTILGTPRNRQIDFSLNAGSGRVVTIGGHYHNDKGQYVYEYLDETDNTYKISTYSLNPDDIASQAAFASEHEGAILNIRTDRAVASDMSSAANQHATPSTAAPTSPYYCVTYPNDVSVYSGPGEPPSDWYVQRIDTPTEVLFDIVTITDDNKVYCTRIGGGRDRVFTLPMPVE